MSDQNSRVTRGDLEQSVREIVDGLTDTGEAMKNPVFLRGLGAMAAAGMMYWMGKRRSQRRIRRAISQLARMV